MMDLWSFGVSLSRPSMCILESDAQEYKDPWQPMIVIKTIRNEQPACSILHMVVLFGFQPPPIRLQASTHDQLVLPPAEAM